MIRTSLLPHQAKSVVIVGAAILLLVLTAITTSAAIDGCSAADFKLARTFEASTTSGFPAASYAVADFNGDGKADIAETDSGAGTVIVMLNDGTGRPVVSKSYGAGTAPRTVAAADLNGDGRPDLIVTNSQNNVLILLNVGSGLFSAAMNFPVATDPIGIAVGDFNGDGKVDIAIGANSSGDGKLSILLGNGSGSFGTAPNSPILIGGQASGVTVADFNSDGKQDVVVATFSLGYFLLLGDGTGRFGTPAKISNVSGGAVATGDLNGDGKPDLAMGTFSGLGILLGNGSGGFSAPVFTAHPGASLVRSVVIADVDGDGKLDVAAAGDSPGGIGYFKGDGSGGFSVMPNYLSGKPGDQIALGDFDSDGDLDIVAGESILTNIGGGAFEAARALYPQTPGSGGPSYLAFGDFNADGRTDMAVGVIPFTGPSSGRLEILLRDASGNYARSAGIGFAGGTNLSGVVAADFNKDGKSDIALPLSVSSPFSFVVSIHLSNGDGTFAAPTTVNIGFQMGDIATGDFNNDGNADLVVVGFQGGVAVLLGNGSGGFSLSFAPSAGTFAQVATADLNSDGKTDLIITDLSNQRVWTEMGSGTGSFSNTRSFAVGGSAAAVAVGDFNLDGKLDLAVANQSSTGAGFNEGSTSILLGDNTGAFAAAVSYPAGVTPAAVAVADFDGDGKPDVAVANSGSSTISVMSGDGSGVFHNPISFNIWSQPVDLLVSDFDSDGRADIAAALRGSRTVGLMFGKPAVAQPCLLVDDATVVEGDSGNSPVQLTVRLTQPASQVVTVAYVTKQSSAIDGQDYLGGAAPSRFNQAKQTRRLQCQLSASSWMKMTKRLP